MPCMSILSRAGTTSGYHWLRVSCLGVSRGTDTQQCELEGEWYSMSTHTPKTQGVEQDPTVAKQGLHGCQGGDRVPDSEGGCVCSCLPSSGHTGGALPIITASAAKLQSRAGASLPPSWPPCLSFPPAPPTLPKPSWHRTHSHSPRTATAHPHPVGPAAGITAPCAQCQPPHTLQPWAASSWGWGAKVSLLLPPRREPLHCPPAQEEVSPKVTLDPPKDCQHHPVLAHRVWGQRSPCWVLLPPQHSCKTPSTGFTPHSHPAWHDSKGQLTVAIQGRRWASPIGALSPSAHG